jgi:hypothetical protein
MDNHMEYEEIKVATLGGRYLSRGHIQPFLDSLDLQFELKTSGISVQGELIEEIKIGKGPITVLMWSQMHGNESTTTKGVLDLLNALRLGYADADEILREISLVVIPILNPDGAKAYTRENANGVDINRDAQGRTQPESAVLREVFERYKPDFCFNLHDQRTIFSAGSFPKPATLSFLSPAANESRDMTQSRLTAMQVIAAVNREMQHHIPGQVGRYDDSFNPNCVGDAFQMLQTPTILVEAGHYPEDYEREETRKYVFLALWKALQTMAHRTYTSEKQDDYLNIPENEKRFFDILIRNVQSTIPGNAQSRDIGILYKEELRSGAVRFRPHLEREGDLRDHFGHILFDCQNPGDLQRLVDHKEILPLLKK